MFVLLKIPSILPESPLQENTIHIVPAVAPNWKKTNGKHCLITLLMKLVLQDNLAESLTCCKTILQKVRDGPNKLLNIDTG